MIPKFWRDNKTFKRAMISSLAVHLALFLLIVVSPSLPRSSPKGVIHYVSLNLGGFPGGGGAGGGSGAKKPAEPPPPKKETLRDLTTPQKLQEQPKSSLRHPGAKSKKEKTPPKEKKAVITKQDKSPEASTQTKSETSAETDSGTGVGSGLRIGVGGGPGGGSGLGTDYSSQIGLSNFPYTYYLQIIIDRISASWFTSLVDPGVRGHFQTTLYFKIYKDGRISTPEVEQSSGIKSLDLSALRAIASAAPFPPLPKDYEEDFLVVHLIFEHSK